ncbi:zinc finger protein 630-like [Anthonomus grandis grandis]|uniref:zinc finger protein 630-like n=1 Tax=Anthonomus grandis grandis TaxID=2921223 RepID=UPI0021652629|nr:zinc finger protein 630-like [Anthonomus grandis grandis]
MSGCYKRVNFYDLCRLCAQNINRSKLKIFEQEGIKVQLQTKIKKCLSIHVKEDDFLPKVVCSKCIKMLDICNTFREECLNSETMLSSYFKNYRHTEDFKQSGKVYIKESQPYTPEPPKLQNNITTTLENCNVPANITSMQIIVPKSPNLQKLQKKTEIKNPNAQNKKHKSNEINLNTNCLPQAQNVQMPYNIDILHEALRKAVQQLPKEILNKVIVNSDGEVINLSPPDNLIDTSHTSQNLLNNSTSVISKVSKKNEIVRQEDSENKMNGVIKIDLTEDDHEQQLAVKFNGVGELTSNVNHNVQNSTVIIPVSQYQNNNLTTVQSNNVYPQPTRVINVICGTPTDQGSVSSSSLNPTIPSIKIEDLATSQSNYIPTGTVSVVKAVPGHVKKEDKVHACDVCSKTFKRREHLYQHVKLHTGFRPYQCSECKKTFVRKEHLLRHQVLHSGERNYSCDICNKSFSRNDNLLKHIRTHNRESSYTCGSCDKVFIMKHFYDSHRSEHGMCYLPPELRGANV